MFRRFFQGRSQDRAVQPDGAGPRNGYFSSQEAYGGAWSAADDDDDDDFLDQPDDSYTAYRSGQPAPDYQRWDQGLEHLDRTLAPQRPKTRWFQPSHWRGRRKRWWLARGIATILLLFFLTILWLVFTAPLNKSLEPIVPPQITLVAADGTPIARNGAITAEPVQLEALPDHVVESFLAIEDRRFFTHWGVDPRGIARAAWTGVGGGSTITQQLAKFTFLTPEQTLTRKAREMLIAFWLETWLTKEEILERYLSNAYFGDNVYGLRAASLHYFYRKPENLKPEQAAMLAGLVQAPSRYAPTRHYDRAKKRMGLVKKSLVAAGYMTQAQVDAMPNPRVDSRTVNDLPTGTYFADWALPEARKLAEGGYASQTITTTLDSRLQNIARRVTARAPLGKAQVALVAMRPNGEVVAMIGGKDYAASPFNRVTQAKRQPGSTFKLFVWLAALESGMQPGDLVDNSEITEGSYRPKNARERYSASITMEDALVQSSNVAAVRLFNRVGDEAVIDMARAYGITADMPKRDPSLALGTTSVSLMELTAAYAGVAANRFPVEPRAFAAEEEGWFDWLWSSQDSLSDSHHEAIQQMLRAVINRGTGRAAILNVANFGKTGTSQGNRDALFVGYAGDLVVGVWVGNDDNTPLNGISGGGLPAQIWRDFMSQALGSKATPRSTPSRDADGPIEPMDVPNLEDIPLGEDGSTVSIRQGEGVTVSTEVEGLPLDIRLDQNGVSIDPGRREPQVSDAPQN